MNCTDVRRLLGAHLDEELDVVNDAAVTAHLESCPACAELALVLAEQRQLLEEKMTYHRAPADLAGQIRAALPDEARGSSSAAPRTTGANSRTPRYVWRQWLALAAAVALVGTVGFRWGEQRAEAKQFVSELTSAHVRARLSGHTFDVASSDRHTVKPWFVGKVDVAPFVPDLASVGFPLLGGRVDRLAGHTVATLVYARRQHTIDVHVWSGTPTPLSGEKREAGFALTGWSDGDLNYTAVTDAAPAELAEFVRDFRAAH